MVTYNTILSNLLQILKIVQCRSLRLFERQNRTSLKRALLCLLQNLGGGGTCLQCPPVPMSMDVNVAIDEQKNVVAVVEITRII